MTDNARKEYLNQFFGSKRYLYQDNERVAHIHVANGNYYFHGHIVPGWQGVKMVCQQFFRQFSCVD
ncbi:SAV1978 family virulence-associated passenger protein, partial [Staphylococcus aureus]